MTRKRVKDARERSADYCVNKHILYLIARHKDSLNCCRRLTQHTNTPAQWGTFILEPSAVYSCVSAAATAKLTVDGAAAQIYQQRAPSAAARVANRCSN